MIYDVYNKYCNSNSTPSSNDSKENKETCNDFAYYQSLDQKEYEMEHIMKELK